MKWSQLLSEKRARKTSMISKGSDMRNEFQKDYHRIIGSASFRRLQDKAQVFPLERSDFVRTRLTHSLEVASYAKSLGQTCFQYIIDNQSDPEVTPEVREKCCQILECAGLLHDIGNPPFGHFGEDAIRSWFKEHLSTLKDCDGVSVTDLLSPQMQEDLLHFEGNAQALRLVSKLHFLVDEHGMNLTYALLNTLIKYPVSSININKASGNIKDKKMGYYYAEQSLFMDITESTGAVNCRYPLTFLLEAADDIAYKTADIEDAVKKGLLSYYDLCKELKAASEKELSQNVESRTGKLLAEAIDKLEHYYQRALKSGISSPQINAVQNWVIYVQGRLLNCATFAFTYNYHSIMQGEFKQELLAFSDGKLLADTLSKIAVKYVFCSQPIFKLEISADTMFRFFLDHFVPAAIRKENDRELSGMDLKWFTLISDNYYQNYNVYAKNKSHAEQLYLRLLLVTDYLCGMTDSYAKHLYQELSGIL